ncbi:MAG: hypothetical protein ACR652_13735 [Methylocystis sp.]|uniref:hypothetical protein n=1 Tax=Methylocystis sp. TaxID=1911079 RepID=UPI003DA36D81
MAAETEFTACEPTLEELEERLERNEKARLLVERLLRGLNTDSRHFPKVRETVIRDMDQLLSGF